MSAPEVGEGLAGPSAPNAETMDRARALVERWGSINCEASKQDGINALWTIYLVDRARLTSLVAETLRASEAALAEARQETEDEITAALKLGDLLRRTCDALKGPHHDPLTLHSWHDLPEVATAMRVELAAERAFCICRCPPGEHESYGDEGEACQNEAHECVRVAAAVVQIAANMQRAGRAEATKAEEALRGMLLSADADWEILPAGGHDWREACEKARSVLIRAPQPPEPEKVPCGRHGKDCHGDGSGSVADPDSVRPVWNVAPSSPPPPSEPRHASNCSSRMQPRWSCNCGAVPSPEPTREEPR